MLYSTNENVLYAIMSDRRHMNKSNPAVLVFTGPSGSGKTTLIEKLVKTLVGTGARVGAIKHSHHNVEIDRRGKDSHRFTMAGANPTVVTGAGFIGYMETRPDPVTLSELVKYFKGKADIIIVEGFKRETTTGARFASVEFVSRYPVEGAIDATGATGVIDVTGAGEPGNMVVVTCDGEKRLALDRDDVESLANWVINGFAGKGEDEIKPPR